MAHVCGRDVKLRGRSTRAIGRLWRPEAMGMEQDFLPAFHSLSLGYIQCI